MSRIGPRCDQLVSSRSGDVLRSWMRAALAAGSGGLAGLLALRYIWFARAALPEPVQHGALTAPAEPEIAADHVRRGHRRLIIVAHGFLKSMNWRPQVAMVREAAQRFDVLCFDFPGHGRSGGWADIGYTAAAAALRRVCDHAASLGYDAVGVVGYSMGAAAAVIAAGQGAPVDAVASVSCPGDPPFMADWRHRPSGWRWVARILGTRLAPVLHLEQGPASLAQKVAPRPLLVVHCGLDTLVREADSQALYRAALQPKDYVCLPRSAHAWPPAASAEVLRWMDRHLGSAPFD